MIYCSRKLGGIPSERNIDESTTVGILGSIRCKQSVAATTADLPGEGIGRYSVWSGARDD